MDPPLRDQRVVYIKLYHQSLPQLKQIMKTLLEWFYEDVYKNNDPRTSEWLLISRPWSLIAIVLAYCYFCVSAGPRYMRDKPPYQLRTTLIVYNFIQTLLSSYLVYEGLMAGWLFEYSYRCQPVDYSESPSALRMARATHYYFLCKISELLDTIFFVLRKKQRQITFLHLYHHASMPLLTWFGVRYFPGGHPTLFGLLNSFVHIIMYGYYMLSAFGPAMMKYLWWKKYLTILQMVQFMIVFVHSAQLLFIDCNIPKAIPFATVVDSIIFLYMFGSFYVKTHVTSNAGLSEVNDPSSGSRKILKSD